MKFELNEKQKAELKIWQDKIKDLFGEYGLYDFIFTPNGIGDGVRVRSHLTNTELDLTDIDSW